ACDRDTIASRRENFPRPSFSGATVIRCHAGTPHFDGSPLKAAVRARSRVERPYCTAEICRIPLPVDFGFLFPDLGRVRRARLILWPGKELPLLQECERLHYAVRSQRGELVMQGSGCV